MARRDLIKEMREGRVVQALLVHLGAAWVVLQVVDVVQNAVGLPQWAWDLVLLLLVIGLIIVLATAWVQAQPKTNVREEAGEVPTDWEVAPLEAWASLRAGRMPHLTWGRAIAGGLVAMALWAVIATVLLLRPDPVRQGTTAGELRSVAVLPFTDLSQSGDQEYFSDGLAEELLNLFVRIPGLRVAARSSSFTYRGEDDRPARVGEELDVSHFLERSVRKVGDRIRITVQLIQVSTESPVWSEIYDRSIDDIFRVQEEIAGSVVDALRVEILGEAPRISQTDPEVFRLVLEGRYLLNRYNGGAGGGGERAFLEALRVDPDYAPAWAGLALLYELQVNWGAIEFEDGLAKARHAVDRALTLDPQLAEAWRVLADIRRSFDLDFTGADDATQRALELEPGSSLVVSSAALLAMALGRFDEALDLVDRAIALDPLDMGARGGRGQVLMNMGRLAEAEATVREVLALEPGLPGTNGLLTFVLLLSGRPQEALDQIEQEPIEPVRAHGRALALHALGGRQEEADEALRPFADSFGQFGAVQVAELHAFRGEVDQAFEWLDRAYAQRDGGLAFLIGDPFLARLATDPRWRALLERVGLPTETQGSSG